MLFALSAWSCVAAQADGRVALVIGNGAYRNVPALPNPTNDASDVAHALERLGFAVTTVRDGGFDDMRHALIAFGAQAREADMAVVYYAGHGMEVSGENWLVPIDAVLAADADVDNESISLKSAMQAVSTAHTLGLVVLDACRNNPFDAHMLRAVRERAVSRGLARVEPVDNVLVAYAAKDGTTATDGTGAHSPFTAALLDHIETPGLEINFLFRNVRDDVLSVTEGRQQPFFYGSLSKEAVYLKAAPVSAPAPSAPQADEIAWSFIASATDAAVLHRFVQQFPTSPHREEADRRAVKLDTAPSPAATEASAAATPSLPAADDQSQHQKQQTVAQGVQSDGPQIEAAWSVVKTSADPTTLRRFTDLYPNRQRRTVVQALGGAPGTGGVLRQLRSDQMRSVLSDYGTFVSHPQYGEVWVPKVTPAGWHPYEPCHWVRTQRLGWYYLDKTPWGAIVHHFGRWARDTTLGWIWIPGVDFSPGWVVWRMGADKIGWAPVPPAEDVKAMSAAAFDTADFWIFMDAPTFAQGCNARNVVPASAVPSLMQSTRYVRDVKVVDGIAVAVLPLGIAGDLVPIDVAFDPWPVERFSNALGDLNWVWNASNTVTAALCPIAPTLKPPISAPPTRALPPSAPPKKASLEKRPAPVSPPRPKIVQRRDRAPVADDAPQPHYRRPVTVDVRDEPVQAYRPTPAPYFAPQPVPIFGFGLGRIGFGDSSRYPRRTTDLRPPRAYPSTPQPTYPAARPVPPMVFRPIRPAPGSVFTYPPAPTNILR